jgi:hypothetical protein
VALLGSDLHCERRERTAKAIAYEHDDLDGQQPERDPQPNASGSRDAGMNQQKRGSRVTR